MSSSPNVQLEMEWSTICGVVEQPHDHYGDIVVLQDEKYAHLEQADMDKVRTAIAEKASWMETQIGKFNTLPLPADPAVSVSQINSQREVR